MDKARLIALVEAGNPKAKAVDKKYPLAKEAKKLEAAAKKLYDSTLAAARKIKPPTAYSRIINTWEGALPGLEGKYKDLAKRAIGAAKDKLLAGTHAKLLKATAKLKGQVKIDALQAALPDFKGSRYEGMIKKSIGTELNKVKAADYAKLTKSTARLKGMKKCDALNAALPGFKGTRYEGMIKKAAEAELNKMKAADYAKLLKSTAKLKGMKKCDALNAALPGFKGTRYEGMIKKAAEAELNKVKAADYAKFTKRTAKLKGQPKIDALTNALPGFKGTRFEKTIQTAITNERNTLMRKAHGTLLGRIKKLKNGDLKIAELTRALPTFTGTRYYKMVETMLKREKGLKATREYNNEMAIIRKVKDPNEKIRRLEAALARFGGNKRHKTAIEAQLKRERTGLMGKLYKNLTVELKKVKPAPKKKKPAVDKKARARAAAAAKKAKAKAAADAKKAKAKAAADAKKAKAKKEADAKKVYAAVIKQLNRRAKTKAQYDENLAKLKDAKLKVEGTRYVRSIDSQIASQEKLKKRAKK